MGKFETKLFLARLLIDFVCVLVGAVRAVRVVAVALRVPGVEAGVIDQPKK